MKVTSIGPARRLGAAILPVPAADRSAFQARGLISGSPGTTAVAAPWAGVPQDRTGLAGGGVHRSSDAPGYIRPALYFLYGPQAATPPVSVQSDNQMPVPAVDPRGVPYVAAARPVFLGQKQVPQPKASPFYRARGSR